MIEFFSPIENQTLHPKAQEKASDQTEYFAVPSLFDNGKEEAQFCRTHPVLLRMTRLVLKRRRPGHPFRCSHQGTEANKQETYLQQESHVEFEIGVQLRARKSSKYLYSQTFHYLGK